MDALLSRVRSRSARTCASGLESEVVRAMRLNYPGHS